MRLRKQTTSIIYSSRRLTQARMPLIKTTAARRVPPVTARRPPSRFFTKKIRMAEQKSSADIRISRICE